MSARGRYGRPNRANLLTMMLINAVIATVVLALVLALFGLHTIIPQLPLKALSGPTISHWSLIWPMLPGAGVCFGCLWYWLVVIGRSRGVPWGGAGVYGIVIALADVPVCGLLLGLLQGAPLIGLVLGLAVLLMQPFLLIAVSVFGATMGLLNGLAAQYWIESHRR